MFVAAFAYLVHSSTKHLIADYLHNSIPFFKVECVCTYVYIDSKF